MKAWGRAAIRPNEPPVQRGAGLEHAGYRISLLSYRVPSWNSES